MDEARIQWGRQVMTYCQEWIKEQIYGFQKEIKSKYLDKGLFLEDTAIDFYSEVKGEFLLKNTETFENEFMRGTPDVVGEEILDFKCSFDAYTFPLFDDKPNPDYVAQLQTYMALTGVKKARLIHVLLNTPEHLVKPWDDPKDYSLVDSKYRIKEYEIAYDQEMVDKIIERVKVCREYIKTIAP